MEQIRVPDVVARHLEHQHLACELVANELWTARLHAEDLGLRLRGDSIPGSKIHHDPWVHASCAMDGYVTAAAIVLAEALSANDHPLIEEALEQYLCVRDAAKILRAREEEYATVKQDEQVGSEA